MIIISIPYPLFKRFCDFLLSLLLLIVFSPLFFLLSLLVFLFLGHPILFRQLRPGLFGVPFYIYKFRTMSSDFDFNGVLLPDRIRLNLFGRFLRSSSLDELPCLLNICTGEMSFIGPRPLLMQYLSLYSPEQARRHCVKPGFSGWAQINGRNSISWERKFLLDVWYVDHQSFRLDLRIFLITFWKVIKCDGISAPGESTMMPFTGTSAPL